MKILLSLLSLLFVVSAYAAKTNSTPTVTGKLDAESVLEKVDDYRNFKDKAFSFDLELVSQQKGKKPKSFGMHAKILDSHNSLVAYKLPKREKGKALLMNGHHLWFFTKRAKKPIRITPQQRLLGEASNGDVASTDFSGDYDVSFLSSEDSSDVELTIPGKDELSSDTIILDLTAKEDSLATYSRIHLWVNANNFQPLKANFFASSGKHLKTAFYAKFSPLDGFEGKLQLTEIEIHNALKVGNFTTMRYSNFKIEALSASQFQPSNIKSLVKGI